MYKLNEEVFTILASNVRLQAELAQATGRTMQGIVYWISNQCHFQLTNITCLKIISEHTGKPTDQLVTWGEAPVKEIFFRKKRKAA